MAECERAEELAPGWNVCGECAGCVAVQGVFRAAMVAAGVEGIYVAHTGGGCRALHGRVPGSDVWLYVTDGNAGLPSDPRCAYVGAYFEPADCDTWAGAEPLVQDYADMTDAADVVAGVIRDALAAVAGGVA